MRTDAVIVKPTDAAAHEEGSLASSYPGQPALAFRWLDTLDPFQTGHPGSAFPISSVVRLDDGRVEVRGLIGVATLRAATANEAARFAGWADATSDAMVPVDERPVRLPLNRKERFYTGTVLPAIVAGDRLADLHRLLDLCGLGEVEVTDLDDVQFFTEYSFAESVFSETDRRRFARRPNNADTPDVVIRGSGWLLAIEAKMFHRPNVASLNEQHARQSVLVDYWAARLGAHPDLVRHVLLLPRALAASAASTQVTVITWEQVLEVYNDTVASYWTGVLREALSRYPDLASKDSTWGQNAQQRLTGLQILAAWQTSDPAVAWIGRMGGAVGAQLGNDVRTGAWQTHAYEVRDSRPDGAAGNWFRVQDFISRVDR